LVWLGQKEGRDVDLRAYAKREGTAFDTTDSLSAPTDTPKSLSLPLLATSFGRLIELGVTQQEIADAVNITRVTVTRLLQQFETEGMLHRVSRQLVLCQCP
jgi:CRP-like cAMP-binding protein